MAELPIDLESGLSERLFRILDSEGKIPRALEALGPIGGRDVLLLDGIEGPRARQLRELGGRVALASARGADGSVASESFVIRTHPDPYTLPNIKRFAILRSVSDRGKPVFLLRFEVENAEEVSIDPQAFPTLHHAPHGQFYVAPEKTTTYTLTVVGAKGRTVKQGLTIELPPLN